MPYAAQPLPPSDVRLTGGPLQRAQPLDAEYLLKLDPDRMTYFFRQRAGLPPKAKSGYGGWDGRDVLQRRKKKITVRFQATGGSEVAAVFGIRTVLADAQR